MEEGWSKAGYCGFDVGCSYLLLSGRDCIVGCLKQKDKGQAERVEELRVEWKRLWRERLDDRVKAEGIANEDYPSLFVEKGTVILATRSFKLLTFKGVLEEHGVTDVYRF